MFVTIVGSAAGLAMYRYAGWDDGVESVGDLLVRCLVDASVDSIERSDWYDQG